MTPPPNGVGNKSNSWPSFKDLEADEAMKMLERHAINGQLFLQPPGPKVVPKRNKMVQDENDDIWVYTFDNNTVAIIPKRGKQHESPVSGWEELTGKDWKESLETILDQVIGVNVLYGPGNFPMILNIDNNRVVLRVDEDGKVQEPAPRLG